MARATVAAGLAAMAVLWAGAAQAQGKVSAGVLLGDGFGDWYGAGLGIRGGYTLPMRVYVGGTFVYHFGTSPQYPGYSGTTKVLYAGPEGGYDIAVGPVLVRPGLGLGLALLQGNRPDCMTTSAGTRCTTVDDSQARFSLWPGVMGAYPIGNFFLGADARYVIVMGEGSGDVSAFSLFLTGGMVF
jgi:hypothetical protein